MNNPVLHITKEMTDYMAHVISTASPAEIFNLLTAAAAALLCSLFMRRFLVAAAEKSKQTDTMLDDVGVRLLLLVFAPTSFGKYDVHSLLDICIACVFGARIGLEVDHIRLENFTWLYSFFGCLRVTLSVSFHLDHIIQEMAVVLKIEDIESRGLFYIQNLLRGLVWIVGCCTLLSQCFGVDCSGLFTGLGASGVVIGFALQNTLRDAFACATIFLDRPFMIDDWIMLGDVVGQVRWIGLRSTKIRMKEAGHILNVPNGDIINSRSLTLTLTLNLT